MFTLKPGTVTHVYNPNTQERSLMNLRPVSSTELIQDIQDYTKGAHLLSLNPSECVCYLVTKPLAGNWLK